VGLAVTQDSSPNQVNVEKTATFTAPNQGYQIAFEPIEGYTGTSATQFVIPDETIANNTGASFNGFSFVLLSTVAGSTTFDGVSRTFIPPTGSGYDYTTVNLTSGNTILAYTGTQDDGATSFWGNGEPLLSAGSGVGWPFELDGFFTNDTVGSGMSVQVPDDASWLQYFTGSGVYPINNALVCNTWEMPVSDSHILCTRPSGVGGIGIGQEFFVIGRIMGMTAEPTPRTIIYIDRSTGIPVMAYVTSVFSDSALGTYNGRVRQSFDRYSNFNQVFANNNNNGVNIPPVSYSDHGG
jgi:hypothetical protein